MFGHDEEVRGDHLTNMGNHKRWGLRSYLCKKRMEERRIEYLIMSCNDFTGREEDIKCKSTGSSNGILI